MNDHWPTLQTKINIAIMGLLSILFFVPAFAADDVETIESVTIVGSAEDARNLPGSVSVISNEDLKKTMDTDIHKILSAVPGVFFRTEDGYGLRPNISIRGTTIDRSAKVSMIGRRSSSCSSSLYISFSILLSYYRKNSSSRGC
jgi:outer membrane receptor for ferrienterochelin and colicin